MRQLIDEGFEVIFSVGVRCSLQHYQLPNPSANPSTTGSFEYSYDAGRAF